MGVKEKMERKAEGLIGFGLLVFLHDWNIHREWIPFMSGYLFPHPHHLYLGIFIAVIGWVILIEKTYMNFCIVEP